MKFSRILFSPTAILLTLVGAAYSQEGALNPDPHDTTAQDLDYFVWLIRGRGKRTPL